MRKEMAPCTVQRGDGRSHYDSRTHTHAQSTAARIDKLYRHDFPESDNPDKRSARSDDGYVTSYTHAVRSRFLRRRAHGNGKAGADGDRRHTLDIDYHHPLEDALATRPAQRLLGWLAQTRKGGKTTLEEIFASYANSAAPFWQRLKYWPLHLLIDKLRGKTPLAKFRKRVVEHTSTVRGLVLTARSVAEFGLTVPQRFSAPLFAVWNFTNQCNLKCKHCYQDSEHARLVDELTLAEKLDLVDQMGALYMPMVAFAGGEPTICPDLLPVLRRCQKYGMHTTIATNGTTMTPRRAAELAEAGVSYVEVSLDSVHPERHDAFRGQRGIWQRTVAGMRCVVAQEGLRLGIAMCVHRDNYDEVEDMLQFAVDIGASVLAHFNFIPVGRGLEMTEQDLTPTQRERLLQTLNKWMQSGRIGILSTAPQLGRVCLSAAPDEGFQACSHAGSGTGTKARVVAKYLGACGAGRTYVCIEPNGDVTPCVYLPHRLLGNIRTRRFADIFRHNEFWEVLCDRDRRTHHCEVCEFKNYCGGCRARADAYFGTLNAGDPGCIFNQKHWDALVADGVAVEPDAHDQPSRPVEQRDATVRAVATGTARASP
jgi:radical SAM protein with 4Fe4S-binding SPASM domain